ncbi:ABC transporter ATP-binding protein [Paenibacillus sp. MMS20-IR301]|uniref:ABC transporter ATP-binding protein n=1 Tax=Paenibacillus sp. MMS20-IR301 TaxID=2895946 RepID=UPI0028F16F8F|nr:ABC transporter ATP-binding protein [Paenibacillus sp. MMS20-IR301]WNS43718.1 ABC transporter ATP-binding protein [Paenibacillus sp. MMS20-IR301]
MNSSVLLRFFQSRKLSYTIGFAFMFAASFIQTLFPKVLGSSVDLMKEHGFDPGVVLTRVLWMVLIAAAVFLCTFLWRNIIIANGRNLECYIREELYRHFLKLSPGFFSSRNTGDLIAYAINDISAVRMTFGPATAMSFNGIVVCLSSVYFMFASVSASLTLITLSPLPFIIVLMLLSGRRVQTRFRIVQEQFGAVSGKVQENISGIRVIKAYVQERSEMEKFSGLSQGMKQANLDLIKVSALLPAMIEFGFAICFVLNLTFGSAMVLRGEISIGDFVAFNGYLSLIVSPIVSIGRIVTIFQRGIASLGRLNDILKVQPEIADLPQAVRTVPEGGLELRALTFHYEGSAVPALKDISLVLPKGHTLGIIGRTGSGKSTLASLLFRFFNADPGKIKLDGRDINGYTLEALREGLGMVPQESFVFAASVRDNIVLFKDGYTDSEVQNAAALSQIAGSIEELPDGYDTQLGERGVNLSGGQKQRLAIARALIRKPAVLILDDALSAVDAVTEGQILNSLRETRKGKSNILISHRVSGIMEADEIVVLDKGQIAERGTHAELLAKGGMYYGIYTEQLEERHAGSSSEI